MQSWNMGYDTDTNYNFGYFTALNPYQTRFNFIAHGMAFPKLGPNTNACELGFGNGVSLVMHAANSQINWYGNDFNPAQVGFAQSLADSAQVKVHISDDAFDQFLERDDLPMFDLIYLHGIWSWISRENQDVIVEFVKRKLKIGGVLYVSYNVCGGFGNVEPFRYLMYTHLNTLGDPALNHIEKIPAALDFMEQLIKLDPLYTKNAPWYLESYKARIVNHDHNYLGHEFFNSNWFLEDSNYVAAKFETAKLNYVCQARLFDDLDEIMLAPEDIEFLKDYVNTPLYEPARDYIIGQTFRSDLYVKGALKLSNKQQIEELDNTYFILMQDHKAKDLVIPTRFGKKPIDTERLAGIIKIFSDYQVHSYKDLRELLTCEFAQESARPENLKHIKLISNQELIDNLIYAVASNVISVVQPPEMITPEIKQHSQLLNKAILSTNSKSPLHTLSAPLLGGGLTIEDIHRLLISAVLNNPKISEKALVNALLDMTKGNESNFSFKMKGTEVKGRKAQTEVLKHFIHEFVSFKLPLIRKMCLI